MASNHPARILSPRKQLLDSGSHLLPCPPEFRPDALPPTQAYVSHCEREQLLLISDGSETSPYVFTTVASSTGLLDFSSLNLHLVIRVTTSDGHPIKETYEANNIFSEAPVTLKNHVAYVPNPLESIWDGIEIFHNSLLLSRESLYGKKAYIKKVLQTSGVYRRTQLEASGWVELDESEANAIETNQTEYYRKRSKPVFQSQEFYGRLALDFGEQSKPWHAGMQLTIVLRRVSDSLMFESFTRPREDIAKLKIVFDSIELSVRKIHPVTSLSIALADRVKTHGIYHSFRQYNVGQVSIPDPAKYNVKCQVPCKVSTMIISVK